MRQFLFKLWTINIQALAHLLTFTFFLPNLRAIYRATITPAHSSSKKLLHSTHTQKKLKVDGEASQTTAKSERSWFQKKKWETPRSWRWLLNVQQNLHLLPMLPEFLLQIALHGIYPNTY